MALTSTIKSRANAQAAATIETARGRIVKIYSDANGNISAADILVDGQTTSLKRVVNSSGIKLSTGGRVTINYAGGSRLSPQITGVAGAAASAAVADAAASSTAALYGASAASADLSGIPILLEGPDGSVDSGYVLGPGANVVLESVDPDTEDGASSSNPNGQLVIAAAPLVVTQLPDPAAAGLPAGTVADLIDSYGNSRGMFRLDAFGDALIWTRRDVGGGITVQTADGTVSGVATTLIFPNGTLTMVSAGVFQFTESGAGTTTTTTGMDDGTF